MDSSFKPLKFMGPANPWRDCHQNGISNRVVNSKRCRVNVASNFWVCVNAFALSTQGHQKWLLPLGTINKCLSTAFKKLLLPMLLLFWLMLPLLLLHSTSFRADAFRLRSGMEMCARFKLNCFKLAFRCFFCKWQAEQVFICAEQQQSTDKNISISIFQ